MHIEVMNRREAVQLCYKPSGGRKVSMISISTPGDAYESHPVVKNGIKAILFVSFFDVTEGSQGQPAITKEDADKIAQFILFHRSRGYEDFIIHCDAGMSRSAGVARAMEVFFDLPENATTYHHGNFANSAVFQIVLRSLMEQSK